MFLLMLKKTASRLLFPIPLIFLLLTAGLILLLWPKLGKKSRLTGKILLAAGILLLLLGSLFGNHLLSTLTDRYTPIEPDSLPEGTYTLVVAGSGFYSNPALPDAHRFNDAMLLRLHEAGRIAQALMRRGIDCKVFASIVGNSPREEKRRALEALLDQYGIPPERVDFCEHALNSRQEVIEFARKPGRIILISESFHIPRLMMLAERYGLDAIPAPASCGSRRNTPLPLIPSAERLDDGERAVYEYLGMLEYVLF